MAGEARKFFSAQETRREIGRDQYTRPLIQTPAGKLVAYTRSSTLGKALDDETGLTKWKQRMTAIGIASRPDLVLAVNAHRMSKDKLGDLVEQGMEAAQSGAAATTGTALHDLCDQYDQGQVPYVPVEYDPDVQAYLGATACLEVVAAEEFAVCDELRVGGTPDRIYRLRAPLVDTDGQVIIEAGEYVIGDIKTGASLHFGHIGYSVQLAVYAHSLRYDISGGDVVPYGKYGQMVPIGDRHEWVPGEKVSHEWGVIIHLPAGTGEATLHPVNLTVGWELAQLAVTVREWRKRKDIIGAKATCVENFMATCANTQTLEELVAAYQRAVKADAWDDVTKQAFTRRKRELLGVSS